MSNVAELQAQIAELQAKLAHAAPSTATHPHVIRRGEVEAEYSELMSKLADYQKSNPVAVQIAYHQRNIEGLKALLERVETVVSES